MNNSNNVKLWHPKCTFACKEFKVLNKIPFLNVTFTQINHFSEKKLYVFSQEIPVVFFQTLLLNDSY